MGIQSALAKIGGDTWRSWHCFAAWPYPAVVYGAPHRRFTWDDYRCFTRHLRSGDIILTASDPYFLSNKAIAGTAFKHAAVYTGPVQGYRDKHTGFILKAKSLGVERGHTGIAFRGTFERTVTHAISEGIVVQDLGELLFHADQVCAVRPWRNDDERRVIVDTALSQVGLAYNFDFKPSGPKAFYCTELCGYALLEADIHPPGADRLVTSALGLLLPLDCFKSSVVLADAFVVYPIVCCSLTCNDPAFVRSSIRADMLRTALLRACDAETNDGT